MRLAARVAQVVLVLAGLTSLVQAQSVLNFPRVSLDPTTFTGLAIANPGSQDAQVLLTLRGGDGQVLTDPVTVSVPAGQQYARLTSDVFGGVQSGANPAWLQASSAANDLTGFFLFLNPAVTFFDGADLPEAATRIAFNEVRLDPGFSTELSLINPGSVATTVSLQLVGGDTPVTRTLELAARGVARVDVADLFGDMAASLPAGDTSAVPARYIIAESDGPEIAGFALAQGSGDLLGQNAIPLTDRLNTLFFPQLAVLGPLESQLVVVNYGTEPSILTIYAHKPDGSLYDGVNLTQNPVAKVLQPGAVLREDLAELFGFFGDESLQGWLEVESSVQEVNGSISYSVPSIGSVAAVTSVAEGSRRAIFSHIATSRGFFTGVAILNAAALVANYEIIALRPDGTVLGSYSSLLGPRARVSMLINEFIDSTADQAGGLILVRSDVPVYLTSLFGSEVTGVLANIPPQPVPDTFQPATGASPVALTPPLAIVAPAGQQTFSATGGTGSSVWQVGGVVGGDTINGMITTAGRYTAPALRPDVIPVTVAAERGSAAGGASVDVVSARELASGLGLVQAVAYSQGLGRVFAAELQAVGAVQAVNGRISPEGTGVSSGVYDVTSGARVLVDLFEDQDIVKMLAFTSGSQNFLLLLDQAGGLITRLNPTTKERTTVVSGLDSPGAMTFDPSNGDLLVAEFSQVTRIPQVVFAPGQAAAAASFDVVVLMPAGVGGLEGIAVNRCDGSIYVSASSDSQTQLSSTGQTPATGLYRMDPRAGQVSPVNQATLSFGHLLSIYRKGVVCPEAFHLLAVDNASDRIALLVPTMDLETTWLEGTNAVDLALIPETNGATIPQGELGDPSIVAIGGVAFIPDMGTTQGTTLLAEAPGLYTPGPVNPPPLEVDRTGINDAVADFSATMNPSGVWSYGYAAEAGAPFTLFQGSTTEELGSVSTPEGFHWFLEASTASANVAIAAATQPANTSLGGNLSGETISAGTLQWPIDRLLLHPGAGGTLSVLRWTAPEAGVYQVAGVFQALDSATADVHVLIDGQIEISDFVQGGGIPMNFSFRRELSAQGTLDFAVGAGGNGFAGDSVGLEVVVIRVE